MNYWEAMDDIAEIVAESKDLEETEQQSVERMLSEIVVQDYRGFHQGDGTHEEFEQRQLDGEHDLLHTHKIEWRGHS
jgi:hypothetical protein